MLHPAGGAHPTRPPNVSSSVGPVLPPSLAKSPFSNRFRLPGLFPRALRCTGSSPHSSCAPRRSPGAWTPMRSESSRLDSTGSVIGSTGSGPPHDSRPRSPAMGWSGLSGGSCVEGRRLDGKRLGVAREEDKPPVDSCRSGGPESHPPATEALMGIARESPGERTFRKVGGALANNLSFGQ